MLVGGRKCLAAELRKLQTNGQPRMPSQKQAHGGEFHESTRSVILTTGLIGANGPSRAFSGRALFRRSRTCVQLPVAMKRCSFPAQLASRRAPLPFELG